jgi:hypothetical protein
MVEPWLVIEPWAGIAPECMGEGFGEAFIL